MGAFQASNALAALGLAVATGVPVPVALDALATLAGAPGRMEHVASHPNGAPVIVDYAHTPDALETALAALRPHCRGRLVVVFGCGGDRDPGKRPMMGAIAERVRRPRHRHRRQSAQRGSGGDPPRHPRRLPQGARDRRPRPGDPRAAWPMLAPGDVLLLAGKGHESGQIVGSAVLPFSDAAEARAAVAESTEARR